MGSELFLGAWHLITVLPDSFLATIVLSNCIAYTMADVVETEVGVRLLIPNRFWYGYTRFFFFFLVGYVDERPWWPIKSPNKGRKKKATI